MLKSLLLIKNWNICEALGFQFHAETTSRSLSSIYCFRLISHIWMFKQIQKVLLLKFDIINLPAWQLSLRTVLLNSYLFSIVSTKFSITWYCLKRLENYHPISIYNGKSRQSFNFVLFGYVKLYNDNRMNFDNRSL